MFVKTPKHSRAEVTTSRALNHLISFQLKLAADALRDLLLSPVSVFVFIVDVIRKPTLEDSLYLKLMVLGRKSDKFINLFDDKATQMPKAVYCEPGDERMDLYLTK